MRLLFDRLAQFIIGKGKMNIRNRITRAAGFLCLFIFVVLGFIIFLGTFGSRSVALNTSNTIGEQSLMNSSYILREQKMNDLMRIVEYKCEYIRADVEGVSDDVRLLKKAYVDVKAHPERVLQRGVPLGRDFQEGNVAALRYAPYLTLEDLYQPEMQREIGIAANLQELFYFFSSKYRNLDYFDAPTFGIYSDKGFAIVADSAVTVEQWQKSSDTTDFWNTPLYLKTKQAWQEGLRDQVIYTTSYSAGINNGIGMFSCSIPYEENGEFGGMIFFSILMDELQYMLNPTERYGESITFILDNEGHVVLSTVTDEKSDVKDLRVVYQNQPDIRESATAPIAELAKSMTAGNKGIEEIIVDDSAYYVAYMPIDGVNWYLCLMISASEVTKNVEKNQEIIGNLTENNISKLNQRFFTIMLIMFAVIIPFLGVMITSIGKKLAGKFVEPIYQLTEGVREISGGNLDKKLDIHTGDEIEDLAGHFNTMTTDIKTYMDNLTKATAEKERLATELDVAKNIQVSMLPNDFNLGRDDVSLYATMEAAKEVGGDFYDFYFLDSYHIVLTIADVSGKGIPAALFMMRSKTILQNLTLTMTNPDDLAAVVTLTNEQLCLNNDADMFVTVFTGILNLKTGDFTFVNGGHNPPLVYRADKDAWEYLNVKKSFIVGSMDGVNYRQQTINLKRGDALYLYTDGVTEAFNVNKAQYGEDRLLNTLNGMEGGLPAEEIIKTVRRDVKEHVGEAEQSDDITMLAVLRE